MSAPEDQPRAGAPRRDRFVVEWFDTIDSTNRYLLEQAFERPDGAVAVADHQTAGRGRRGRVWDSKPGASLLFSTLFRHSPAVEATRAVALAVVDAMAVVGDFRAELKWPNDVLVGERKLAGILTESVSQGAQSATVVGCGLNLNWEGHLPDALIGAVSADEAAGHALDPASTLSAVLDALTARLGHPQWLATAYRERCATIGRSVTVERANQDPVVGTAVAIDDAGALVVETPNGPVTVTVGEAVHTRLVS